MLVQADMAMSQSASSQSGSKNHTRPMLSPHGRPSAKAGNAREHTFSVTEHDQRVERRAGMRSGHTTGTPGSGRDLSSIMSPAVPRLDSHASPESGANVSPGRERLLAKRVTKWGSSVERESVRCADSPLRSGLDRRPLDGKPPHRWDSEWAGRPVVAMARVARGYSSVGTRFTALASRPGRLEGRPGRRASAGAMQALGISPDRRLQAVAGERDVEAMGGDESGNRTLERPVTQARHALEMSGREKDGARLTAPRERDLLRHDVEEGLFVLLASAIGDAVGELLQELRDHECERVLILGHSAADDNAAPCVNPQSLKLRRAASPVVRPSQH